MTDATHEYSAAQEAALSQGGSTGGCAECHSGNWIHIRYEYTDDTPVTDAVYVVQEPNDGKPGGQIIAEGVMAVTTSSAHDYVHVDLGEYSGEVEVYFYDDPEDVIPYEEPNPVKDERAWYQKAADATVEAISDAASWTGGTLAGDFNEDMTSSQIIANTVITMIPGVDQIGDVRDLAAHAKMLIWDERWNDRWVWVGVVTCLIGLVPTLGSLAKGIIRLAFRNLGNIGDILVLINRCADKLGFRINGVSKIHEVAQALVSRSGDLVAKFNEYMDLVAEGVRKSVGLLNRGVTERVVGKIEFVKSLAAQKIPESAKYVAKLLTDGLARAASTVVRGRNRMAIRVRRVTSTVIKSRRYESWDEIAEDAARRARGEYDPDIDDLGAVPVERIRDIEADALARRMDNLAAIKRQIAEIPDSPWKNYSDKDLLEQIEKFNGTPRIRDFETEPQTLYRVVQSKYSSGGDYWSPSAPPDTEAAWRSRDAVLQNWNEAGAYVVIQTPPPRYGMVGEVGPQRSTNNPDLALLGGGTTGVVPKSRRPTISGDDRSFQID
ncbi:hypothetical protein BFP70_15410 [Thioclava sp. SK-1]|uniref:hypothetical protein n=1 Tax=Thioclava sp. SK-1 TaxID=1889770 RepID=UPI000825D3A5|nr:hypothetical protein [Thioclava sp. SK-1]OCX61459.1 hypothetical protein BFP70_15410 [Thioclava sp. SK-1]